MVKQYVPKRGDLVSIQFDTQAGREQAGRRPAIVLSDQGYNDRTGLCIACPITSTVKAYPFEVHLPNNLNTKGVILVDHMKSLDWRTRNARYIEHTSTFVLDDVIGKIERLIAT